MEVHEMSSQKPAIKRAGGFRAIVKTIAGLGAVGLGLVFVVFIRPRAAKLP
jgi:hypothetical protein